MPIKNGYVDFSSVSELKMSITDYEDLFPTKRVDPSWNKNYEKFDQMLARKWMKDGVPTKYKKYIRSLNNITDADIKYIREIKNLTWHEAGNMQDIFLISKDYHNGLSHRGGRANAKLLKLKELNK